MCRVVVYPNNSVTIDGRGVVWGNGEFKKRGIDLVRFDGGKAAGAQRKRIDGDLHIIFPNKATPGFCGANQRKKRKP